MRATVKAFPTILEDPNKGNPPRVGVPGRLLAFPDVRKKDASQSRDTPKVVTQNKLREAKLLLEQELQLLRRRRELMLEIVADLQAGAELEPGELSFDPELRTVQTVSAAR